MILPCSHCKEDKDESKFSKQPNTPSGFCYVCKVCKKIQYKSKVDTFRGRLQFMLYSSKSRNKDHDLDLDYLVYLYHKQEGKCALTGIDLTFERGTVQKRIGSTISLDRIDNGLGYVKNNVQFLCCHANLAKNIFTTEEFVNLCRLVTENQK